MAVIRPFHAIRYARTPNLNLSNLVAPPYDVLDEKGKAALLAKDPKNIVGVDLPHLPPKTVGPDAVYAQAASTFQSWINEGTLIQDTRPGFYPYMQTYTTHGRTFHRKGFFALVKLSPFGKGQVVPHEKTYANPIEDRMKLMRATQMQLSPIFGLYSDPKNEVTGALYKNLVKPDLSATLDSVKSDLWTVSESSLIDQATSLMSKKPIYIADGHHRYTTALRIQEEAIAKNGGKPLPDNHPLNYCLFVLISMQDDGLIILPTHRFLGGLKDFSIEKFTQIVATKFDVKDANVAPEKVADYARDVLPKRPAHTFGIFDPKTKKTFELTCKDPDVLKDFEPNQSPAWRKLDVAILQRFLLDEMIKPYFSTPETFNLGYTAEPNEIVEKVDGQKFQAALMLQSTPLHALEDLGKHGEVMPQKSTYFFPKLVTGMVINPLNAD